MGAHNKQPTNKTSFNAAESRQMIEEVGGIEVMADVIRMHIHDIEICRIGCVAIIIATIVCKTV